MRHINEPVEHPGFTLGYEIFRRGLSVAEAARLLGLNRSLLAKITAGANPIRPSVAHRLELAGVGTAAAWLAAQSDYDVWRVRCTLRFDDVQPFPPPCPVELMRDRVYAPPPPAFDDNDNYA